MKLYKILPVLLVSMVFLLAPVFVASATDEKQEQEGPLAETTSNPQISSVELKLLLVPLTKDELLVEARGWQKLLKAQAIKIAEKEIFIRQHNREIEKTKNVQSKTQEIQGALTEISQELADLAQSVEQASGEEKEALEIQKKAGLTYEHMSKVIAQLQEEKQAAVESLDVTRETRENLVKTVKSAEKVRQMVDGLKLRIKQLVEKHEGNPDSFKRDVTEIIVLTQQAIEDVHGRITQTLADLYGEVEKGIDLDAVSEALTEASEHRKEEKVDELVEITVLREKRTLLIDNLRAVIDELQSKTDAADTETVAKITDYRLYLSGVSGITLDIKDTMSTWVSIKEWILSEEGGHRWLKNLGIFLLIIVASWYVARFLALLAFKAMRKAKVPALLSDFLTKIISFSVLVIGFIWALSALEISIAPLLAIVGATGFILAFAMQESLSNFAAGMMIMIFRPFDIGDSIEAGGVSGKVHSASLVSTTILTFDNKMMMVPNSKIWNDVIVNITGVTERRIDMEFSIGYQEDSERAEEILREIVSSHPKVLRHREAVIKMHMLAESAVIFICRPWSTPGDYWSVFWDITREVKRRFDAEGISIPYTQRDVHVYLESGQEEIAQRLGVGKDTGTQA